MFQRKISEMNISKCLKSSRINKKKALCNVLFNWSRLSCLDICASFCFSLCTSFIMLPELGEELSNWKLLCKYNQFHTVLGSRVFYGPCVGLLAYSALKNSNWGLMCQAANGSEQYNLKPSTASVWLEIQHAKCGATLHLHQFNGHLRLA